MYGTLLPLPWLESASPNMNKMVVRRRMRENNFDSGTARRRAEWNDIAMDVPIIYTNLQTDYVLAS